MVPLSKMSKKRRKAENAKRRVFLEDQSFDTKIEYSRGISKKVPEKIVAEEFD